MAIVNGTDFEFIDLQSNAGGNTTRHMIKDAQARNDTSALRDVVEPIASYAKIDFAEYTAQGFINTWGNFVENTGFWTTDFIEVPDNCTISGYAASNGNYCTVAFYKADKSRNGIYIHDTTDAMMQFATQCPADTKYIRCSARIANTGTYVVVKWTIKADVDELTDRVSTAESNIDELESEVSAISELISKQVHIPFSAYTEHGYVNAAGVYIANEGFRGTDYIQINGNETISGFAASNGNYAIVAFYNSEKVKIGDVYNPNTGDTLTQFAVSCPDGARYIRCSARAANTSTYVDITYDLINRVSAAEDNIEVLTGEVSAISESISKQIHIPFSAYTEQGYINVYGRLDANAGFVATDFIQVDDRDIISGLAASNGNYAIVAFYDSEQTKISDVYHPNTGDVSTEFSVSCPAGTKYIRSSARVANTTTYIDITYNLSQEVSAIKTSIAEIESDIAGIESDIAVETYRVGFVSATTGNDYKAADIVDCLWAIHNNPNAKKELHIKAGTYDIYAGLGGLEHITQYSVAGGDTAYTEGTQPWLTNLKIVGYGNVVLEFNIPDSVERDHYWIFSALNVRGNFEMENIEIHSSNCRYAIHDESKDDYPDTIQRFTNVRIYNNVLAGINGGQAVGCGFAQRMSVYMDNCYIEDGFTSAWTCHANNGVMLTFNGCVFTIPDTANYRSVRISQNGQTNVSARFVSCYLSKGLRLAPENASDTSIIDTTEVTGINTDLSAIVKTYTVVQKRVITYNAITQSKTIVVDVT